MFVKDCCTLLNVTAVKYINEITSVDEKGSCFQYSFVKSTSSESYSFDSSCYYQTLVYHSFEELHWYVIL
jgi:hypothetical protein